MAKVQNFFGDKLLPHTSVLKDVDFILFWMLHLFRKKLPMSLTHSLTRPLTHPLAYSTTCSFSQLLTRPIAH